MAAPLAPEITQTVPTTGDPVAPESSVATLAQPAGETDPGPFTYAKTQDPGGAFTLTADTLYAARELDGAFFVAVTATGSAGTSPEGSATLVFADNQNAWDDLSGDHADNPQFPPFPPTVPTDGSLPTDGWKTWLRMATYMTVPLARDGVDFVIARASKFAPPENIYWDDTVLGARPQTEIENVAKQLAAAHPGYPGTG